MLIVIPMYHKDAHTLLYCRTLYFNPLPPPGNVVGEPSMAVGALGRPPGAPPGPPGSARWLPGTA